MIDDDEIKASVITIIYICFSASVCCLLVFLITIGVFIVVAAAADRLNGLVCILISRLHFTIFFSSTITY